MVPAGVPGRVRLHTACLCMPEEPGLKERVSKEQETIVKEPRRFEKGPNTSSRNHWMGKTADIAEKLVNRNVDLRKSSQKTAHRDQRVEGMKARYVT